MPVPERSAQPPSFYSPQRCMALARTRTAAWARSSCSPHERCATSRSRSSGHSTTRETSSTSMTSQSWSQHAFVRRLPARIPSAAPNWSPCDRSSSGSRPCRDGRRPPTFALAQVSRVRLGPTRQPADHPGHRMAAETPGLRRTRRDGRVGEATTPSGQELRNDTRRFSQDE